MNKVIVSIVIIALLLGFTFGYITGTYATIKGVAKVASGFVDKELIDLAVFQYNERIDDCFPNTLKT